MNNVWQLHSLRSVEKFGYIDWNVTRSGRGKYYGTIFVTFLQDTDEDYAVGCLRSDVTLVTLPVATCGLASTRYALTVRLEFAIWERTESITKPVVFPIALFFFCGSTLTSRAQQLPR